MNRSIQALGLVLAAACALASSRSAQKAGAPSTTQPAPAARPSVPLDELGDPTRVDDLLRPALRTEDELGYPGPAGPRALAPAGAPSLLGLVVPASGRARASIGFGGSRVRVAVGDAFASAGGEVLVVDALQDEVAVLEQRESGERRVLGYADVLALTPLVAQSAHAAAAPETQLALVDLRGLPLGEACRLLSDATGANVVASESAAATSVALYLRQVSVDAAIEALCDAHQLWSSKDAASGILRVRTAAEYERRLGSLQEEKTEYFTLLYPNVFDVGQAIQHLFGERVVLTTSDTSQAQMRDITDRLARFDLLDARKQGFGGSQLGGGGIYGQGSQFGVDGGLGQGGIGQGALGQSGIYGQGSYGSGAQYGEEGGGGMRTPSTAPPELESELGASEIARLERLLEAAGGDAAARAQIADMLAGVYRAPIWVTTSRRQNKLLVRTSDERALSEIRTLVQRLDVPTALVLLEVRILSIDMVDGYNSFFEYQWADGDFAGQFSTGAIAPPTPPALGVGGTGVRPTDLVFQFVDSTFAARLQLLERENRVRTVATPVLLTANNEVSRLFVGREVPLNRTFSGGQIVANENTTQTVSGSTSIEFRPVGTTLLVTPNINADRTVTLKIVQESSNADATASILVPAGDEFEAQTVNVVSSQSVSGTIVAKSDLAVAFGGLIESSTSLEEERVPVLGSLPVIGTLFRRTFEDEQRRELIVIVRPHVLATPAEHEATSRRLVEALGVDAYDADLRPDAGHAQRAAPRFEVFGIDAR